MPRREEVSGCGEGKEEAEALRRLGPHSVEGRRVAAGRFVGSWARVGLAERPVVAPAFSRVSVSLLLGLFSGPWPSEKHYFNLCGNESLNMH